MSDRQPSPDPASFGAAVRDEGFRFGGSRSQWFALQCVVLGQIAVGALIARSPGADAQFAGVLLTQLIAGVSGTVAGTTAPLRQTSLRSYWARACVWGGLFAVATAVGIGLTTLAMNPVLAPWGLDIRLDSPDEFRRLCGACFFVAASAGAGVSIGVLLRHRVSAVMVTLGWLLVIPVTVALAEPSAGSTWLLLLPSAGMWSFISFGGESAAIPAAVSMLLWAGAGIGATALLLQRRVRT
ncbi:hypothetical protein [Plantibacter sp. RU18]|uniref:hypothetical protein n=1 Tax=Plantibacter sp. RU18 TaxID=3158143 RepID=UPI003D35AC69